MSFPSEASDRKEELERNAWTPDTELPLGARISPTTQCIFNSIFKCFYIPRKAFRFSSAAEQARSLLNKICPDNLAVIVDQLASIKLDKAEELQCVIRIIFKKAMSDSGSTWSLDVAAWYQCF